MDFSWPEFEHVPLDGARTWSSAFDSYDQRHDDAYYVLTLREQGRETTRFMVCVGVADVKDDEWTSASFVARMKDRLHRLAASGTSNTDYTGPVIRSPS